MVIYLIPFGKNIRRLRNERNWSQAKLAAKLGVSDSQVAHYESEDRLPSLPVVVKASHVFGVTTDYLLGVCSDDTARLDLSGLSSEEIELITRIAESYRDKK